MWGNAALGPGSPLQPGSGDARCRVPQEFAPANARHCGDCTRNRPSRQQASGQDFPNYPSGVLPDQALVETVDVVHEPLGF